MIPTDMWNIGIGMLLVFVIGFAGGWMARELT